MSNLYRMRHQNQTESLGPQHMRNLLAIANLKKSLRSPTSQNTLQRHYQSPTKLNKSVETPASNNARGCLACLIDDDFAAAMDCAGVPVIGRYFKTNDLGRAWADS